MWHGVASGAAARGGGSVDGTPGERRDGNPGRPGPNPTLRGGARALQLQRQGVQGARSLLVHGGGQVEYRMLDLELCGRRVGRRFNGKV